MTIPTISTLPTAPARTDAPATFITRADAFLAAIVTMQSELNTSIGAMNTDIAGVNADATAAAASASAAATSESNASTSESNAATSETNAASSAAAAASSYDQFDDRYLGSKASDPAVDNDGNALLTGALYFNSTSDDMKVYTGTTWKVTGFNPDSPTFTDTVTAPSFDLNSIAETKAETAVDVFVYDTRKDSDGGAWRKRTQNTSWYNETLNTATRGSRKEFPAVAVIVAEVDQLTIYDGDDPSLPMWALWTQFNAPLQSLTWWRFIRAATSVSALNGIVAFGQDINADTASGLSFIDFNKDIVGRYCFSATQGGIGMDASSGTKEENLVAGSLGVIVNNAVNDVAMTVLPNAPIDAATGLPVPTIAVATEGGVSVIKDDGSVVDIVSSYAATDNSDYVEFTKSGGLILDMGHNGDRSWLHTFSAIPLSDTVVTVNTKNATSGLDPVGWYDVTSSFGSDLQVLSSGPTEQIDTCTLYGDTIVATTGLGMTFIDEYTPAPSRGMTNFIASNYNTGWMNGDIKLATLSDTDDTDVTGSELVVNGDFSSATGWSVPTGVSISGGVATFSSPSHGSNLQQTATSFVSGKTYTISVEVTAFTSGGITIYANASTGTTSLVAASKLRSVGVHSFTWTALGDGTGFTLQADSTTNGACILTLDNISVRIAEEDRSVNNNGLQVFGTITKDPVATGADLVAYSGFSASNYLEQPYNSDLDFGTGDFCVMGWFKTTTTATQRICGRNNDSTSSKRFSVWSASDELVFYFSDGGITAVAQSFNSNNVWQHFACRRLDGIAQVFINGVGGSAASAVKDVTVTGGQSLYVGAESFGAGINSPSTQGSIALFRISATAPTAEQIAKIYEDEKVLFQDNAQATLYGSSDAVTALAYDGDTELLHVGTSAGRSVFQGLRRVDNTTGAVGAAISASNGLVAED